METPNQHEHQDPLKKHEPGAGQGKPEDRPRVYEFQVNTEHHEKDLKTRVAEVLQKEALSGNRNLLFGFAATVLLTLLATWPYLERKIDQTPQLYAYAVEHQNDTSKHIKRQEEQEALPIVNEDDREKRIQELERAREKRVKESRSRERTSTALDDSLQTLETADVNVETFGAASYSYKMKEGESLEALAQRFNLHPDSLRAANPGAKEIQKGTVVDIPLRAVHTMKSGQTLSKISKMYLVDKDLIRRANQMKNDYLAAGQSVYIPRP